MKKNKLRILIAVFFFLGFKFSFSQEVAYTDTCGNTIERIYTKFSFKEFDKYKFLSSESFHYPESYDFFKDRQDTLTTITYKNECVFSSGIKINNLVLTKNNDYKYNFGNQKDLFTAEINCNKQDSISLINQISFLASIRTIKQVSISLSNELKIPKQISLLKDINYLTIGYGCENPTIIKDSLRQFIRNNPKTTINELSVNDYFNNYQILELPESLTQLSNLKFLMIYVNGSLYVKENFWQKFNQLEELVINADSVHFLRDDYFKNAKLKKLVINYNYPDYFRYDSKYLTKYNRINHKKLKTNKIPNYLFELANTLEQFEFNSLALEKDDLRLAKLKRLKIFNGYICKKLDHLPGSIDSLPNLEKLIVYGNSKNYVQKTQLLNLKKLNTIYFEGENFNKNVCIPPNLNELVITKCHNNLTDLKYVSPSVKKLILLDVDLNEVAYGIQNHHFEKVFVDLKDLVRLRIDVFEKINTDTLVVQRLNNSVKKRDTKYYEYWRKINRCFKTDTREYQTWLSEFKKRSTIKVIEVKEWH